MLAKAGVERGGLCRACLNSWALRRRTDMSRLALMAARMASSSTSREPPAGGPPALATTMSTPPKRSTVAATSSAGAWGSVTSATRANTGAPKVRYLRLGPTQVVFASGADGELGSVGREGECAGQAEAPRRAGDSGPRTIGAQSIGDLEVLRSLEGAVTAEGRARSTAACVLFRSWGEFGKGCWDPRLGSHSGLRRSGSRMCAGDQTKSVTC